MALLIVYDAATAIQEQTIRRPFPLRISEEVREFRGVSLIFGAARKYGSGWIGQVILIGWKCSATLYIYIYIGSVSSLIQISLNIIDISCLHIFILLYWFYSIQRELIDVFSIIIYSLSTFCPTLGHHQGRMYYKSDVTFVCTLLLCKKSIWAVAECSVYF